MIQVVAFDIVQSSVMYAYTALLEEELTGPQVSEIGPRKTELGGLIVGLGQFDGIVVCFFECRQLNVVAKKNHQNICLVKPVDKSGHSLSLPTIASAQLPIQLHWCQKTGTDLQIQPTPSQKVSLTQRACLNDISFCFGVAAIYTYI